MNISPIGTDPATIIIGKINNSTYEVIEELSVAEVIENAVSELSLWNSLYCPYSELKDRWFVTIHGKKYQISPAFIEKVKTEAERNGLHVEVKDKYQNDCQIGESYGICGKTLRIIQQRD